MSVFTPEAAGRIAQAVRQIESERTRPRLAPPVAVSTADTLWARVTSGTPDGSGHYSATITLLNPATLTWSDYGACKVRQANGMLLASGARYSVLSAGRTSGGDNLFLTADGERNVRGKLDGAMSYQGSATMSIWYYNGSAEADTGVNVTVYDWLLSTGQSIASGKQVVAAWDAASGRYYVTGAQCA